MTAETLTIASAVSIDVDSILDTLEQAIPLARYGASLTETPWDDAVVDGLEACLKSEPLRKFLREHFGSGVPRTLALSSEAIPPHVQAAAAEAGISVDRLQKILALALKLLVLFG